MAGSHFAHGSETFVVVAHEVLPSDDSPPLVRCLEFRRCADAFHQARSWVKARPGRNAEVWLDRRICLFDTMFGREQPHNFSGPLRPGWYRLDMSEQEDDFSWSLVHPRSSQAGSGAVAMGEHA